MSSNKFTFIGIISVAGGGSIPPVMKLASGLKARGHEVIMICDDGSLTSVEAAGFQPIVVPPEVDFSSLWRDEQFRKFRLEFFDQKFDSVSHVDNLIAKWADMALPSVVEQVKKYDPDLIFASLFSIGLADSLGLSIGKPWCMVNPAFYLGEGSLQSYEEDYRGFSAFLFRDWLVPIVNRADLVLHTTDREYDPVVGGLPENHYQVGPLNREVEAPPVEGLDDPGDPWVLVSVSTGPQIGELQIVESAIDVLSDRAFRVLVTAPGRSAEFTGTPENIRVVEFASHDEILKRSQFVISHAGHGAVMKALIHGVPMILVPWDRDQPGVAARAEQLGVAVVVPRQDLSRETLGAAIDRITSDKSFLDRSISVAARLSGEDPLGLACDLMERAASGPSIAT